MSPATSPLVPYEKRSALERSVWYMGSLVTVLARSEDTAGKFGLFEMVTRPGAEPPAHVHEREDELIFVKEGDVDCYLGGHMTTLSRSGSVFLPRGVPHRFKVLSAKARFLVLVTPGGYEGIFRDLGEPAERLTLPETVTKANARQLAETVARYGVRFLPRAA
jgi:quercetin dioxygenase-like cupin family protein